MAKVNLADLEAANERLKAEVSETAAKIHADAAEIASLKDQLASGDPEAQARVDELVASLHSSADALDSLQPKEEPQA